MSDFDTDKFLSLMSRVSRLEEDLVTLHKRDSQIETLFTSVSRISNEIASLTAQINLTLKYSLAVFGIVATLATGFWSYHSSQTSEIEHQITQNNKVMHP